MDPMSLVGGASGAQGTQGQGEAAGQAGGGEGSDLLKKAQESTKQAQNNPGLKGQLEQGRQRVEAAGDKSKELLAGGSEILETAMKGNADKTAEASAEASL